MTFSHGQINENLAWFQQGKRATFSSVLNYVIKHCAMKTWGSGGIAPSFFTSALGESERAALPPGLFTSRGIEPSIVIG
jgi:hypothetical protein